MTDKPDAKLKRELGWAPRYASSAEGVATTVAALAAARPRRRAQRRSVPAHAANVRPPAMPVAVERTPAAATAATPSRPRMTTAAAAPTLGPMGSWLNVLIAISTATASR